MPEPAGDDPQGPPTTVAPPHWLAYALWPLAALAALSFALMHVFGWDAVDVDAVAVALVVVLALLPLAPALNRVAWQGAEVQLGAAKRPRPDHATRARRNLDNALMAVDVARHPSAPRRPSAAIVADLTREETIPPKMAAELVWVLRTLRTERDPRRRRQAARKADRLARQLLRGL